MSNGETAMVKRIARLEAELMEREQTIEALEEYIRRYEGGTEHLILVDMGFAGFGLN